MDPSNINSTFGSPGDTVFINPNDQKNQNLSGTKTQEPITDITIISQPLVHGYGISPSPTTKMARTTMLLNLLLQKMGYFERNDSKKFAMIITAILVSTLAIGIGLTIHFVGADNMLHWFQGDFTSWFKNNIPNWFKHDLSNWFKNDLVTWTTHNAGILKLSAAAVGGVALGVLIKLAGPKIKEKARETWETLKLKVSENQQPENHVENVAN